MKTTSLLACAMILSLSAAPFALAQTPAPAPAATDAKPAATDDAKAAKAKECIAEANAKGLHGKERKKFKSQCKHAK